MKKIVMLFLCIVSCSLSPMHRTVVRKNYPVPSLTQKRFFCTNDDKRRKFGLFEAGLSVALGLWSGTFIYGFKKYLDDSSNTK